MSTKNIARSAVEGGRSNQYERNESHARERSRARVWLDSVRLQLEMAEESVPEPRPLVSKKYGFTDKLRPCYGWLQSRCGRPWSEVRSELFRLFDTRRLSAWHVVNQHMLTEVRGAGTTADGGTETSWRRQRFYIDEDGILKDHGTRKRAVFQQDAAKLEQARARLGNRKVVDRGNRQFWAHSSGDEWLTCERPKRCVREQHRTVDCTPPYVVDMYTAGSHRSFQNSPHWRVLRIEHVAPVWRAGERFSKEETAWWEALPSWIRFQLQIAMNELLVG